MIDLMISLVSWKSRDICLGAIFYVIDHDFLFVTTWMPA